MERGRFENEVEEHLTQTTPENHRDHLFMKHILAQAALDKNQVIRGNPPGPDGQEHCSERVEMDKVINGRVGSNERHESPLAEMDTEKKQKESLRVEPKSTILHSIISEDHKARDMSQRNSKSISPSSEDAQSANSVEEDGRTEYRIDSGIAIDNKDEVQSSLSVPPPKFNDETVTKGLEIVPSMDEQTKVPENLNKILSTESATEEAIAREEQDTITQDEVAGEETAKVKSSDSTSSAQIVRSFEKSTSLFEVEMAIALAETDASKWASLLQELGRHLQATSILLSMDDSIMEYPVEGVEWSEDTENIVPVTDKGQLENIDGSYCDEWEAIVEESVQVRNEQLNISLRALLPKLTVETEVVSPSSFKYPPSLTRQPSSSSTSHTLPDFELQFQSHFQSQSQFSSEPQNNSIQTQTTQLNLPHSHSKMGRSNRKNRAGKVASSPSAASSNATPQNNSSSASAYPSLNTNTSIEVFASPMPSPTTNNAPTSTYPPLNSSTSIEVFSPTIKSPLASPAAVPTTIQATNPPTGKFTFDMPGPALHRIPSPSTQQSTFFKTTPSPGISPVTGTDPAAALATTQPFTVPKANFTFDMPTAATGQVPSAQAFTPSTATPARPAAPSNAPSLVEQLRIAKAKLAQFELEKVEWENVRDQHESCLVVKHGLETELKREKQLVEIAKKCLDQKKNEMDVQSKQIESLELTLAAKDEFLEALKARCDDSTKAVNDLKAKFAQYTKGADEQAASWDMEKNNFLSAMDKIEKDNIKTKSALSESQKIVERDQELLSAAQAKASRLEGENLSLKLQMQELSKQRKTLENQLREEQHLRDSAHQDEKIQLLEELLSSALSDEKMEEQLDSALGKEEKIQLLEEQLHSALNIAKRDRPLLNGRSLESELQEAEDATSEASILPQLELSGVTPVFEQKLANGHNDMDVRPVFGSSSIMSMDIAPGVGTRAAESDKPLVLVKMTGGTDPSVRVSVPFFATVAAMVVSMIIFYGMTWTLSPAGDGGFGVGGPAMDSSLTRLMALWGVVLGEGSSHQATVWA